MGTKTENFNCAEFKLGIIKEVLDLDCSQIAANILPSFQPLLHLELSEEQTSCMNREAANILKIGELNNFVLKANSFKTILLDYKYVHFVFADKHSLRKHLNIMTPDFGHDLYYMIINCDTQDLNGFNFSSYRAYVVNEVFEAQVVKEPLSAEVFSNLRKEFLIGIGALIRGASTLNAITEYITFSLDVVNTFREGLGEDYDMNIKIICIKKSCNRDTLDINVSSFLNDYKNQDKLSMAFQKNGAPGTNTHYFDIGNMHP